MCEWSPAASAAAFVASPPVASPFAFDRARVAMEAATAGSVVGTATAGAVVHFADASTGETGNCPPSRLAWGTQNTIVMLPEEDDSPTPNDRAAGVVQGGNTTAGAVVQVAHGTAGVVGEHGLAGPPAEASDATTVGVVEAEDATTGGVVDVPAARGLLPGSSSDYRPPGRAVWWDASDLPPPPGGKAEGRWRGWYDPKRWKIVAGKKTYRSYGLGPETGGNQCPQSTDPFRTERNRRKKAKKERRRKEREESPEQARGDAWQRQYERQDKSRSPCGVHRRGESCC